MELQKGRPKYTAGRLEKEIRTYDLLDKLGVAYERVDHAPAMTMEVCQEIDKVLQATICKNNISKVVSKISRPTKERLLCYSIFGGNFG